MPNSMTGFSRQEAKLEWGTITWEIRSVNHRYLEPHLRLPDIIREQESVLRDELRKKLSRGKIEASFSYQIGGETIQQLSLNAPLVAQLTDLLGSLSSQLENSSPINPVDLLRWPGVISDRNVERDEILTQSLILFRQTLNALIEHREREGAELKQLISQRLDSVKEQVSIVRELLPQILKSQRQRLINRLNEIKDELDQNRLEQELVYLAQKSDVDEELDRLDTHVIEVRRTLNQKGSIGRRLDFLMQELNREANTLSSKSIVTETTQAAIELKVLIEQMREQIQNIE